MANAELKESCQPDSDSLNFPADTAVDEYLAAPATERLSDKALKVSQMGWVGLAVEAVEGSASVVWRQAVSVAKDTYLASLCLEEAGPQLEVWEVEVVLVLGEEIAVEQSVSVSLEGITSYLLRNRIEVD